ARAANAFAAGAAEGQCGIDLRFDPDQRIKHHRPAIVEIDIIGVDARVLSVFLIPAIDAEFALALGARIAWPDLAFGDAGIFWKRDFDHGASCFLSSS